MDTSIEIIEARSADISQLSVLFDEAYGPGKRRFLLEHGDWVHRGPGNRWVALIDGVVAGYRGIIPATCVLGGEELPAVWAMNLYVLLQFRGRGLQRPLDQHVLDAAPVRMSFPGEIGAAIYTKQGYSLRQDLAEWRLPLSPLAYWRERSGGGLSLTARRALLCGRVAARRVRAKNYRTRRTELVDSPDLGVLEDVFRRHVDPAQVTTLRDAAFLGWRYGAAPYAGELLFYVTSLRGRPTHYAVVRHPAFPSAARVLDLFGDFRDEEGLDDLLRTIVRDAIDRGRNHASILVSSPRLENAVRGVDFHRFNQYRFRWSATDPEVDARLSQGGLYWVLGDSDNDFQAASFR